MIAGQYLGHLAECRDCHEPIRFVRMDATGRNMPINPAPSRDTRPGTVAARPNGPRLTGYVITTERPQDPRHPYRFTPHYATCQKPTKKHPPTEPGEPALF